MNAAIQNLDRDMDRVFDSLYVVNTIIPAIVRALPPDSAVQVMRALDEGIDGMQMEKASPCTATKVTLFAWRNMAATQAGQKARPVRC